MALRRVLDSSGTHLEDLMATTRRKIANAEEARRLLDDLERSGLDRPTFCQREGIDGRSLNCWRLNMTRKRETSERCPPEALRVVELSRAQIERVTAPSDVGSRYRVAVADAVIEVDDAFRDDTLARLLSVVRAC